MKDKILVVAIPFPSAGGGALRALRSINEYMKHFDVHIFLPYSAKRHMLVPSEALHNLMKSGVTLVGFSKLPMVVDRIDSVFMKRIPSALASLILTFIARLSLFSQNDYKSIVSLHDHIDAVYAGYALSNILDAPAICLLHDPPFYGSKERLNNIMRAHLLWRKCTVITDLAKLLSTIETIAEYNITNIAMERIYSFILQRYDMVIAVSKSTSYEMGGEWINRIYALNPGVSLNEEDLKAIGRIREGVKEKGNYIIFGGRPVARKGVVEALIAFRYISRSFSDIKLIITGFANDIVRKKVTHVCRSLGIEDKVMLMDWLPRDERLGVVARAKLMLYPSHVDAFSYAVLESLHLGTPVVAYNIPALELYYSRCHGVRLVKEWDLEALAVEAMNILEKGVEAVEPPKLPSWREIMDEEVRIIKKIADGVRK